MMTRAGSPAGFAACIERREDDMDLVVGKIYRILRPCRNDEPCDIRVVDESGEDYLYPRDWFVRVGCP